MMKVCASVWCLLLMVVLLLPYSGCSGGQQPRPDRASVSGVVRFGGQPLKGGTIRFASTDNPLLTKNVMIRSDGTYSTDMAPLGKSVVTVDTETLKYGNAAAYVPIPSKYGDAATSGLTAELEPGENKNVDFALEN